MSALAIAPPVGATRMRRFALLAVGLAWLLAWNHDTVLAMVETWYRSTTFNHGFVVLPIALWLIWRQRRDLADIPVGTAAWPLPLLAVAALVILLGDLAGANALAQLALVTMALLVVIAVLGSSMARALAFPLAFLFFMVPIGDFALPTLMDWTARFTVLALRLTGIPVYQEGLQFVIPSGNWSVVEACSGVRYLIASTCVGTLFAYLNYVSLRRRLLFVAVSILVPIVANWLRAYMIVMIGHLSGNQLAVGIDHLIYGWVFFGIVILTMFAIGARWAEAPQATGGARPTSSTSPAVAGSIAAPAVLAVAAILVAIPQLARLAIVPDTDASPLHFAEPQNIAGWMPGPAATSWTPAFEQPNATLDRSFTRDGRTVGLHVVYYRGQDRQRKLVSSTNVLVRSDDRRWALVDNGTRTLALGGAPATIRRSELRGASGRRLVVWHWYAIQKRITSSEHWAKLYTALDLLRGRGDDGAGVFVYAWKDEGDADALIGSFVQSAAGPLAEALRQMQQPRIIE